MAQNDLDVIFIYGGEEPNTYRRYLMNGVEANAHVFKKRGQPPVALVNPMELDEAKPSGLQLFTPHDLGLAELRRQCKDRQESIFPATFAMIFDKLELKG